MDLSERVNVQFLEFKQRDKKFIKDGNIIIVSEAPEPTDVKWGNLSVDTSIKFLYRMLGGLGTLFILAISANIIYQFSLKQ